MISFTDTENVLVPLKEEWDVCRFIFCNLYRYYVIYVKQNL